MKEILQIVNLVKEIQGRVFSSDRPYFQMSSQLILLLLYIEQICHLFALHL
jgi:hypothetical protein